jgi:hypothetical protein
MRELIMIQGIWSDEKVEARWMVRSGQGAEKWGLSLHVEESESDSFMLLRATDTFYI